MIRTLYKAITMRIIYTILLMLFFIGCSSKKNEHDVTHLTRMATLHIMPQKLPEYLEALHKQMDSAISLEPGVLSYYAVADKMNPSHITIFEVYASEEAYQAHILTNHFIDYKETVKDMVLSLELMDVTVIAKASK
jgi:quinol monooxygenase YgiN